MIGQTISHYRIVEKLGEGGMGVVYKAEDTKLKRSVALKFLAAHLLKDEEARKRFDREAQAAAALHHPNVCPVYEIGEANGQTFLAMASIEGESLDEKIEQGPLKIPEALDIARQIAKGLEAAHKKKIVHRDIKPGNVIVDDQGHVTVMDFSLALLAEGSKLTQLDTTVGTAAYMSPEQIQGIEVDHRTDIWALGAVLYEMVCGQRPFKGVYDKALLYEIVQEEFEPITAVRAGVPMELEFIVAKCLAKDRGDRYQNAGDATVDLRTCAEKLKSGRSTVLHRTAVSQTAAHSPQTTATNAQQDSALRRKLRVFQAALAVTAALAIGLLAVATSQFRGTPPDAPLRRFAFTPEDFRGEAAISPNGKHIVYLAGADQPALWVRDLDSEQPRELLATAGASDWGQFWSPDSQFIGFAAGGELKKISVQGGPAITLCSLPPGYYFGGSWSSDGNSIAFSAGAPAKIYEVPPQGGDPKLLFEPEQSEKGFHSFRPRFLPGKAERRGIVFTLGSTTDRDIVLKNLETGESSVLAEGAYPVFSPTGHILYQRDLTRGGLWVLPFSVETLEPTGEPFPIAENVGRPSLALDGAMVSVDALGSDRQQLVWLDRTGRKLGTIGRPQRGILYPSLSPGGRRVVVTAFEEGTNWDIWVHKVDRALKTRLTFDPAVDIFPRWSPSGEQVVFNSSRDGNFDIYSRAADGSGEPVALISTPLNEFPSAWTSDMKYFLYTILHPETELDIWYLERKELEDGFDSRPFLQTPFLETNSHLSPDGRFVAYLSDQSGRFEVYVRPFPQGGGKWQVSANGGNLQRWSRDGTELFYVEGKTLMSVAVSTAESFSAGPAKPLFEHPRLDASANATFDVSADGQRFVVVEDVESEEGEEAKSPSIHVVENWYEEFRDREQD